MGKIIGYILAWLTKKGLWSFVYYGLISVYFVSLVSMIVAFFVALDYFIQLVRDLLSMTSTPNLNSDILNMFFSALNCIGFTQAFNDASPVLVSGIVFIIARITIIQVNRYFRSLFGIVSSIMNTGV